MDEGKRPNTKLYLEDWACRSCSWPHWRDTCKHPPWCFVCSPPTERRPGACRKQPESPLRNTHQDREGHRVFFCAACMMTTRTRKRLNIHLNMVTQLSTCVDALLWQKYVILRLCQNNTTQWPASDCVKLPQLGKRTVALLQTVTRLWDCDSGCATSRRPRIRSVVNVCLNVSEAFNTTCLWHTRLKLLRLTNA